MLNLIPLEPLQQHFGRVERNVIFSTLVSFREVRSRCHRTATGEDKVGNNSTRARIVIMVRTQCIVLFLKLQRTHTLTRIVHNSLDGLEMSARVLLPELCRGRRLFKPQCKPSLSLQFEPVAPRASIVPQVKKQMKYVFYPC